MAPKRKLRPGHCANPAAIEAWKGYDWAKALDDSAMFATKENAAMMVRYMKQHAGDGPSCLYLSLLAFARQPSDFFSRQWGEVPIERVDSVVSEYVRMTRIGISVYTLGEDGKLRGQVSFRGSSDDGGAVVLIPGGNGIVHALPLARPSRGAVVIPSLILRDIVGAPDPAGETQSGPTTSEPAEAERSPADAAPQPTLIAKEALARAQLSGRAPVGQQCLGTYVGPGAPPEWFAGDWVAGFGSGERKHPPGIREWMYTQVFRPTVAAATVANFRRYSTQVFYVDLDTCRLTRTGRRQATDGHSIVEFFTEGDCLVSDGCRWNVLRVKWLDHSVLQIVPADITTRVFGSSKDAKVLTAIGVLDRKDVFKARCTAMRLTRDDPVETSIVTRWIGDWAAKDYDVQGDPDDVAVVAKAIASQYRSVGSIGGGYGWGNCYSCGGQLTGKSRICCRGVNSPLARIISAGEKVTSLVNRVLYPGVVWCRSQHPPLKQGVETNATAENFW